MNDDDQPEQWSSERAIPDVDYRPRKHGDMNGDTNGDTNDRPQQHSDMSDDSRTLSESQKQQDCMLYTVTHKAADTVCDNSYFMSNVHTKMTYDNSSERKSVVDHNGEHTGCARTKKSDSNLECRNRFDFPVEERGQMAGERRQDCVRNDKLGMRHRNNCDAGDCRSSGCSALDECDSGRRLDHASDSSQTTAHGGAASHCFDDESNPCDDMENYFRINAHLLEDDTDASTGRETRNTLDRTEEHSRGAVENSNLGSRNKSVCAKDDENCTSTLQNTSSDSGGCSCNLEETVESASRGESCDSCRKFSHELDVVLRDTNHPNDLDAERPDDDNRGAHRNVQDTYPAFVGVADNLQEQMADLGFEDEFPDAVPRYQNVATSQSSDSGAEDFIDVDISKHVYADFDSISCGSNSVQSSSSNEDLSLNAAVDSNVENSSSTAIHYSHRDDVPEAPTPDAYSSAVSCILDEHCGCDSGECTERPSKLPGLVKSLGVDTRSVPSTESDSTSQSESSCYLTLSSSSSLHSPLCVDSDRGIGVATPGSSAVDMLQGGGAENVVRQRETDQQPLDDTSIECDQTCHVESSDRRNRASGTLPMQTRHCPCRRRDGPVKKTTWPTKAPQQFVRSFSADTISSYAQAGHMTARTMLGGEPCRNGTNNLNVNRENICNHDREDMFNVSRQMSTSSDQDEDNVRPGDDHANRRRRCPHFKDSVVESPPSDMHEERRNDYGVDRSHQSTQDSCIECAHGKESEPESRSCVYCNIHSPDPDFQHHARGRMRESCSDTDLTFSATAPHGRVDASRQLSLGGPDIPRLQVVYREQMISNGHRQQASSCCDEEIKNNLQNDQWAKQDSTGEVTTSAGRRLQHSGRDGQALVFTKFVQDYCRTQLQALHGMRVVGPPNSRAKCSSSAHPSGGATKRQDDDLSCVMIWSEYDARQLQVEQVGTSACGATAAINVLRAFEMHVNKSRICDAIHTNLRAEKAALPEYLLSRSIAGCTANDVIQGIELVTEGSICGVFFKFYPARDVKLLEWLVQWMRKGAVPLLTLNLQKAVPLGYPIPDAWHHQMVYGVDQKGVYMTNPLNLVPEADILQQLCTDSLLLVRRDDIVSHWTDDCDLTLLIRQQDPRWRTMNVLGQVVNVLREDRMSQVTVFRPQLTTHVQIPAWYAAGVTLFARRGSDTHRQLLAMSSELPVVRPTDQ